MPGTGPAEGSSGASERGAEPGLRPSARLGSLWHSRPRVRELAHPLWLWRGSVFHIRLWRGGYTLMSPLHGRHLFSIARRVERSRIPGAIVDCGVWNGGSTALMGAAAPSRDVWAFDSFEGMPAPSEFDGEQGQGWEGKVRGSVEMVRAGFERYADPRRLHVVKGWFEETFPQVVDEVGPVALLHVDADWYESVLLALRTFYPRLSEGGYVAMDDYQWWPGARRATDELRAQEGITSPMVEQHYWEKARA